MFGVVLPSEKQCQSLMRGTLQKINNGITAPLLQRLQCCQLMGVTLHCPRKISASCDAAFCQNSLTTCLFSPQR